MSTLIRMLAVAAALAATGTISLAQQDSLDGPAAAASAIPAAAAPTTAPAFAAAEENDWIAYRYPSRKGPRTRVISTLRAEGRPPDIAVLAPEQNGRTTAERPTLLWFISAATSDLITIRLSREDEVEPVYELILKDGVKEAGVQVLDLSAARDPAFKKELELGVEYTWSIELNAAPNKASSQATVERIALQPDLLVRLRGASPSLRAAMLARRGIWYDTVAEVHRQMQADPKNANMREAMKRLLKDASLQEPQGMIEQITRG